MTYKLRAEVKTDAVKLLFMLNVKNHTIKPLLLKGEKTPSVPDVEVEFESDKTIDELRRLMAGMIDDSHVMTQTIKPIAEYTGERNYDL